MANESLGTSDGASMARHHTLDQIAHHATALFRPADLWDHPIEELIDLAHTRHHGGEPVVSAHSLDAALSFTRNAVRVAVRDSKGELKQLILDKNVRCNNGGIWQAALMGGGAVPTTPNGTATTAPTATTLTLDGKGAPGATNTWNDMVVHLGSTYGVILSNTNVSSPVLTIDKWYDPASPSGAALATPAAGAWHIRTGRAPAVWIAMSTNATAEDRGDTTLTGEFTTNFSTTGRWYGTYTLTTTPSGTGSTNSNAVYKVDAGVLTCTTGVTVTKLGLAHTQNGGNMDFTKLLGTAATAAISDTVDPSWALTLS